MKSSLSSSLAVLLATTTLSAAAAPVVSDNGRVQVGVTTLTGFASDFDNYDPDTGTASVQLDYNPASSTTYRTQASALSRRFSDPDEPNFFLAASSQLNLTRAATDPNASGFAGTEPGRSVSFTSLGGELRLDYALTGSATVTNEAQANNSFAQTRLVVGTDASTASLLNLYYASPNPEGFNESGFITFLTEPGEVVTVILDAGASGYLGGSETAADVRNFSRVTVSPVPEPASLLLLAGLALPAALRRRRPV